jgi:cholestenol delta-isomerase
MLTAAIARSTAPGKEYSKADSRYATRDDFVISMEAVTAFLEGPGCLLICWAMLKCKPWRFTAILLVSLGQLYGDVLYFGTCIHGGESCLVKG